MAKKPQARLAGRDAITGQFVPMSVTVQRPNTTIVQRIPLPKKGK